MPEDVAHAHRVARPPRGHGRPCMHRPPRRGPAARGSRWQPAAASRFRLPLPEHYRPALLMLALLLHLLLLDAGAVLPPATLSVLDFGAVGDGHHDDTGAIQTALHFAGRATRGNYAGILSGGHASLQHPTLLFPTGTYRISRALHVNGGVDGSQPCDFQVHDTNQSCVCPPWLRGESALLLQSNPAADILFNPNIWRWKVSGLHFVGGRNHIFAGNNNTDTSFVTVSDCLFANASSAAIRTMGPAWWDAAAAREQGSYFRGTASTQFTIRSSQFYSNEQVVVNWCDQMVVEDVWVEHAGPNGSYAKALFENHDRLFLSRMLGVPKPIAGNDQRWIDNHNHGIYGGLIVARDCRFGGESGGFTVVVNYASFLCAHAGVSKWSSGMPGGYKNCASPPMSGPLPNGTNASTSGLIIIDSCEVDSHGNHQRFANIYLEALPAQIIVKNSRGFDFAPLYENPAMQLIRVNPKLDLDGPQLDIAAYRPGLLRYEIGRENVFIPDGGSGVADRGFPQQLWPYVANNVEAKGPPTAGVWRTNQIVWSRRNASAVVLGWRCIVAGKPGVWEPITAATQQRSLGKDTDDRATTAVATAERLVQVVAGLAELWRSGSMDEQEFARAKTAVLAKYEMATPTTVDDDDDDDGGGGGGGETGALDHSVPRHIAVQHMNKRAAEGDYAVHRLRLKTDEEQFDVVVFGATPGGIAAAIAAHRTMLLLQRNGTSSSPRVALVEPSAWIGGMASGGLGCTDKVGADSYGGIAREFVHETNEYYGGAERRPLPHCTTLTAFEPHVATAVFRAMLATANVTVFREAPVLDVTLDGMALTSVQLPNRSLSGLVFIDASYEGDLMAMSGVDFTVGRESQAQYGEPLAGRRPLVPGHCYGFSTAVNPYMSSADAASTDSKQQTLPMVWDGAVVGVGEGDSKVMSYNYRLCLTNATAAAGARRQEITYPADYNPAYFELLRRYMLAAPPAELTPTVLKIYDIAPYKDGMKTDVNSASFPLSTNLVGGSWQYPNGNRSVREAVIQRHQSYTKQLLWFLKTDPAVPSSLRKKMSSYAWCGDEFVDNEFFPTQLYVREARRMVGAKVLTSHHATNATLARGVGVASIGVADYAFDCHPVEIVPQTIEPATAEAEEAPNVARATVEGCLGQRPVKGGWQIPYAAINPRRGQMRNLLVPVALSASHVAFASIRLELTWMVLGQSAGAAAAIAVTHNLADVQDVPLPLLHEQLQVAGQVLTPHAAR